MTASANTFSPTQAHSEASFSMTDEEFRWWVRTFEDRIGVLIPESRRLFLEMNLKRRLRETGQVSLEQYYQQCLQGIKGTREWATLIDRLTVHQTHFFRHLPSMYFVRDEVARIRDGAEKQEKVARFNAWSVGCATGEEAYSLAMVIDFALKGAKNKHYWSVTGTDVSANALDMAKRGMFQLSSIKEIPDPYRSNYLLQGDKIFRINESLQKRVAFAGQNLQEIGKAPMSSLNLIYCQNVLIYFPRERRHSILEHLTGMLADDGVLVLGSGEVTNWHDSRLRRVQNKRVLAFRKLAGDEAE